MASLNNQNNTSLTAKQSIKMMESKIENFKGVGAYQISLLSNCKINISQKMKLGNKSAVRHEKSKSENIVRLLEQSLTDLNALRDLVIEKDLIKFDKLVSNSKTDVINALKDFAVFCKNISVTDDETSNYFNNKYQFSYDDTKEFSVDNESYGQIQFQLDNDRWELENQKEMAETLNHIQSEVQIVNELFHDISGLVHDQKETVDNLENNVENAHTHVVNAEKQLIKAAKLKTGMYPLAGAIIGSIIGGPIGFVAGIKMGTLAALSFSALGFMGGRAVKKGQQKVQEDLLKDISERTTIRPSGEQKVEDKLLKDTSEQIA